MTIAQARGVLVEASGSLKRLSDKGLRRRARGAVRFTRRSCDRTFHDMEMAQLVETMLDEGIIRWPEPHEITGTVLFRTGDEGEADRMGDLIVALTRSGKRFTVKHEVTRFVVKLGSRRRK